MANVIKPKRSYTATNTPTLAAGELGLNAADGKIWIGNAAGSANVLVSSLTRSDHTGTLSVVNGGTGATTLTANNVILGNGTSAPTFVAPSTSGNLLTSNGTTWQSSTPAVAATVATGIVEMYAGATAPTGYLLCDGAAVSRSTYSALFAITSTTYGAGDGSTTFNVPNLSGRMVMGAGTGTGLNASGTGAPSGTAQTARTRGQWLGEETHALTTAELASHTHANTVGSSAGGSNSVTGYMNSNSAHTHDVRMKADSSVVNGNFVLASSGTPTTYNFTSTGGTHGGGSGNGDGKTVSTNTDHTHAIGINNVAAGGGGRHDTIPPVLVMNFIIKT